MQIGMQKLNERHLVVAFHRSDDFTDDIHALSIRLTRSAASGRAKQHERSAEHGG